MLKNALCLLLCALLCCCSEQSDEPVSLKIPVPEDKNAVEPSVADLLNRTGSQLSIAMDDPKKWLAHGSALYANGYYRLAIEAFEQVISMNPNMPQATYLLANGYWKINEQKKAVSTLRAALDLTPNYDIGWRLLAEWQLERGESQAAEEAARRAYSTNPNRIGTGYIFAQSLMDNQKYDEAIQFIENAIESKKAPPWIYGLATTCYRQLGDHEKAEECKAISGAPPTNWPDPMFKHIPSLIAGKAELAEYAMHVYQTAGSEKALPFLQKAVRINPEHVNVRVALSVALQTAGKLNDAKQLLLELNGEPNVNYWKQFAGLSLALNDIEEAQRSIQKAILLDTNDPNVHEIAAVISQDQGEHEAAFEHLVKAGHLFLDKNMFDKAETSLALASTHGDLSVIDLGALATAQLSNGNELQAKISIEKILLIDAGNEVALELQERLIAK